VCTPQSIYKISRSPVCRELANDAQFSSTATARLLAAPQRRPEATRRRPRRESGLPGAARRRRRSRYRGGQKQAAADAVGDRVAAAAEGRGDADVAGAGGRRRVRRGVVQPPRRRVEPAAVLVHAGRRRLPVRDGVGRAGERDARRDGGRLDDVGRLARDRDARDGGGARVDRGAVCVAQVPARFHRAEDDGPVLQRLRERRALAALPLLPGRARRQPDRRAVGRVQGGQRRLRRRVDPDAEAGRPRVGPRLPPDAAPVDAQAADARAQHRLVPAHALPHLRGLPHAADAQGIAAGRARRRPPGLSHLRVRTRAQLGAILRRNSARNFR